MKKSTTHTTKITDPRSVEAALRHLVKVLEAIPPGAYMGTDAGATRIWAADLLAPALNAAQGVLGLPQKEVRTFHD